MGKSSVAIKPKITQQQASLEAQLQATLNVIPAYTWYALPTGALTFVNERTANYLGLPKDHPLRFANDTGGEWASHISLLHLVLVPSFAWMLKGRAPS
jgi:hypothetical protein